MKQTEMRALAKETFEEVLDEREAREEQKRPVWFWRIVSLALMGIVLLYVLDWACRTVPVPMKDGVAENVYVFAEHVRELKRMRRAAKTHDEWDELDQRIFSESSDGLLVVGLAVIFLFALPFGSACEKICSQRSMAAIRAAGVFASGFSLHGLLVGQLENVFAVAGRLLFAFWTIVSD